MKESSINEILGGSEATKHDVKQFYKELFETQNFLDAKELPKTAEEILIINLVNKETNEILVKFGLEKFDITKKNIHILAADSAKQFFKKIDLPESACGAFDPALQAIFLKAENDQILFMQNLTHEMCHLKAYQSLAVFSGTGEKKLITDRRAGFFIQLRNIEDRRKPSGQYVFSDLNEAVIDILANQSLKNILASDSLPEKLLPLRKKYEAHADEVFEHSYAAYKLRFWDLLTGIYKTHKDQFKSPEEVFNVFAESIFKKEKFLEVAKLIESSFGKGSFRIVGERGLPESKWEKGLDNES